MSIIKEEVGTANIRFQGEKPKLAFPSSDYTKIGVIPSITCRSPSESSNEDERDDEDEETSESSDNTRTYQSPPRSPRGIRSSSNIDHLSFSHPSPYGVGRRRASIQVVQHQTLLPEGTNQMRSRMRRGSIQCEAVITKQAERGDMSKMLSELKLQCTTPSPLHAVMRQYGSASNLTPRTPSGSNSTSSIAEVTADVAPLQKDVHSILKDWNLPFKNGNKIENINSSIKAKPSSPRTHASLKSDVHSEISISQTNSSCGNSGSVLLGHQSEQSFSSDYYGSMETIHSVQSLPVNGSSVGNQPGRPGNNVSRVDLPSSYNRRRHSLPTNQILQSTKFQNNFETVSKTIQCTTKNKSSHKPKLHVPATAANQCDPDSNPSPDDGYSGSYADNSDCDSTISDDCNSLTEDMSCGDTDTFKKQEISSILFDKQHDAILQTPHSNVLKSQLYTNGGIGQDNPKPNISADTRDYVKSSIPKATPSNLDVKPSDLKKKPYVETAL